MKRKLSQLRQPFSESTSGAPAQAYRVQDIEDRETLWLVERYLSHFRLDAEPLRITTNRRAFETLLGRRVGAAIGGAYVYHPRLHSHLVLINLERIDRSKLRSLEIVVAEEMMHMRDWIDGDRRRHAKHGYDRIALRVADLTGASLEDVRTCLIPPKTRPARYVYRCPGCQRTVNRKRTGVWSCGSCAPTFDRRFVLRLERDLLAEKAQA
jgi:predicted SprT family Zn-dependent metalloprotease